MEAAEIIYPDLDSLCRLCLKENAEINIFNSVSETHKPLSLPIRIMSCAALEVQINDGLPSNICEDCRIQLERSYYFRKRCQLSDLKLRKHFRLVNAGKQSKVFMDDDDDDDELEFQDSLNFLKSVDEIKKIEEQNKWEKECRELIQLEEKQKFENDCSEKEQRMRNAIRQEEAKKSEIFRLKALEEVKEIRSNFRAAIKAERAKLEQRISNEYRFKESKTLDELNHFIAKKRKAIEKITVDDREVRSINTPSLSNNIKLSSLEENENDNTDKLEEHYVIYNTDFSDNELGDFLVYDKNDKSSQQQNGEDEKSEDYNMETVNQYIVCNDEYNIDQKENCDDENIEMDEELEEDYAEDSLQNELILESEENSIKAEYYELQDEEIMYDNSIEDQYEDDNESTKEKKDFSKFNKSKNSSSSPEETNRKMVRIEMVGNTTIAIEQMSANAEDLKTFRCTKCSQAFTKKSQLERHRHAHEKSTGYYCKKCSKWFTCKSSLDRHARIHTGEKPFKCGTCSKSFMQREVLKRHSVMHTGVKPYPCDQCDKSFIQKKMLSVHVNKVHLNCPIVEYNACHLCPKKFLHASGLSRHLQQHTGTIFTCGQCSRSFNDKSAMKRHVLSVHEANQALKEPKISIGKA